MRCADALLKLEESDWLSITRIVDAQGRLGYASPINVPDDEDNESQEPDPPVQMRAPKSAPNAPSESHQEEEKANYFAADASHNETSLGSGTPSVHRTNPLYRNSAVADTDVAQQVVPPYEDGTSQGDQADCVIDPDADPAGHDVDARETHLASTIDDVYEQEEHFGFSSEHDDAELAATFQSTRGSGRRHSIVSIIVDEDLSRTSVLEEEFFEDPFDSIDPADMEPMEDIASTSTAESEAFGFQMMRIDSIDAKMLSLPHRRHRRGGGHTGGD